MLGPFCPGLRLVLTSCEWIDGMNLISNGHDVTDKKYPESGGLFCLFISIDTLSTYRHVSGTYRWLFEGSVPVALRSMALYGLIIQRL